MKSADLYMWLGDGGGRDYSSYVGKKVILRQRDHRREARRWAPSRSGRSSGRDYGDRNFTKADVWNCDFSSFTTPGKYRLAIEGVGCSPEFKLSRDIYFEPFKTSVRGFYYMRIGEPKPTDGSPVPRQPRFIPGKDPANFKVYLTTYGPWHPDWKKKGGDQWDNRDWSMYKEPGNPTNPNAYGGHSDAADLDRHLRPRLHHLGHAPALLPLQRQDRRRQPARSAKAATASPTSSTRPATRSISGCACAIPRAATRPA